MALDFKIDVSCVVQWFSALTDLNRILDTELKNSKKYHEVVNGAIMDAIVKPFGGKRTPRSCMLTSVARVPKQKERENFQNERMAGERETHTFFLF